MAKKKTTISDRTEFDATLDTLARKAVELTRAKAERDAEAQDVAEHYKPAIEALENEMDALLAQAKKYAEKNRASLFPDPDKKSDTTQAATFGFRTSPEAVKSLGKAFDEARCIQLLKSNGLAHLIRNKETLDKDAILALYKEALTSDKKPTKNTLTAALLASCDLKIVAAEKFFVEPIAETGNRVAAQL